MSEVKQTVKEFAKSVAETSSAEAQLDKAREKLEKAQARASEYAKAVELHNVYFLSDSNKYATRDQDSRGNTVWTFITEQAAAKFFNLASTEDRRIFDGVLREKRRIKMRSVNSFSPQPDTVLNLISTDGWVQPESGRYDPVFDVLMDSLSGGRQNVRDHIEKVLVYKYLHPEEYKLPCITISGEGGVGKNDFVEKVLATIFGKQQIAAIGTEEAFGAFNGQMLGKTVVFIDEALSDKTNAESLKRKVGNETIQINMKYGIQGTFDNTPWYWLGGNGTNGAVMLAGDTTDRRYSVITVKENLMYWVGKHLGIDVDTNVVLGDDHPCVQWYCAHAEMLRDRQHVAYWLGSIVDKWKGQVGPPSALHDADYKKTLRQQKSIVEDCVEFVFDDPEFTHIQAATLYAYYKAKVRVDNPAGRPKGRNTFLGEIRRIVEKKYPRVEFRDIQNIRNPDGKRTSAAVFCVVNSKTILPSNSEAYVSVDAKGIEHCVEREAPITEVLGTVLVS